ncbi:carbonic anhydrase [Penicillium sp. DV-2018c]|nr:carbonic anhydrase [Penicillium sp. DV-2018c]
MPDSDAYAHGRHQQLTSAGILLPLHRAREGDVRIYIPLAESAKLENLGAGLEVVLGNGTLTTSDNTYQLVQFHWHTPSEHRIDQKHFPLEAHFVFQDTGICPHSRP